MNISCFNHLCGKMHHFIIEKLYDKMHVRDILKHAE